MVGRLVFWYPIWYLVFLKWKRTPVFWHSIKKQKSSWGHRWFALVRGEEMKSMAFLFAIFLVHLAFSNTAHYNCIVHWYKEKPGGTLTSWLPVLDLDWLLASFLRSFLPSFLPSSRLSVLIPFLSFFIHCVCFIFSFFLSLFKYGYKMQLWTWKEHCRIQNGV